MPQALLGVFSLILPLHPHCISELALQVRELYHKEVNKWPKVTEPGEGEAGAWIQGFVQLKQAPILSCCLSEVLPPRSVWSGSQMPVDPFLLLLCLVLGRATQNFWRHSQEGLRSETAKNVDFGLRDVRVLFPDQQLCDLGHVI